MSEATARRTLQSAPVCVRYLYDSRGNIHFGSVPPDAVVVPARALLSKKSARTWLAVASMASVPVLLEACGPGERDLVYSVDAAAADAGRDGPRVHTADASITENDAADAEPGGGDADGG
jgi:hypothetical protein